MNLYNIQDLTKRYGTQGVLANDAISLEVRHGEMLGVFGPNGAGKTTLVRQMTGLLRPTSGRIELLGQDVVRHPGAVSRYVSFYGQRAPILRNHTVTEVLVYAGVLRGLTVPKAHGQAQTLLERFELLSIAKRRLAQLSGGQVRLPTLLSAFMGELRGVVLDEPTNELDPVNRQRLWQLLEEKCREGVTVVLTSHNLAEAERYVERVAFINHGRLVALGTPGELKRTVAERVRLEVRVKEPYLLQAEARLRTLPDCRNPRPGFFELTARPAEAQALLGRVLEEVGMEALDDFRLVTPSMDDVYVLLTSQKSGGARDLEA